VVTRGSTSPPNEWRIHFLYEEIIQVSNSEEYKITMKIQIIIHNVGDSLTAVEV